MIRLNGKLVKPTVFPDGTSQVWKTHDVEVPNSVITWEFRQEGEFMQLAQLKTLLDHHNVNPVLYIEYLPYGRQDKTVSNENTFALKTFADLLNTLRFKEVRILDPHSEVALELINNSVDIVPDQAIEKVFDLTGSDAVCYPDSGARNRYARYFGYDFSYGKKNRNQSTGYIEGYEFVGDVKDKKILIVDDICDGGTTFTILTKELFKNDAKEVNLYVTHGIFSKGLRPLREAGISRIFTFKGECVEYQDTFATKEIR